MNKEIDLNTLSTVELKAFAYDHSSLVGFHRNQVQMANTILEKRAQEELQVAKEEPIKSVGEKENEGTNTQKG